MDSTGRTPGSRAGRRALLLPALVAGLARSGWDIPVPPATMFAWAPIPEPFRAMGSLEFAKHLLREAKVAVAPGIGFGGAGDGHVRFALVENEHRIRSRS